jgi:hypothetical protein
VGNGKGEIRGFFPFGRLGVSMTGKGEAGRSLPRTMPTHDGGAVMNVAPGLALPVRVVAAFPTSQGRDVGHPAKWVVRCRERCPLMTVELS